MFGKSKPVISVCIPVFNSEDYLEACLNSVDSQTISCIEVIIVDDGSFGQDSSGRDCRQIVSAFKKNSRLVVRLIEHRENKGLVEARRSAVLAANGEYIFNLDSDDTIPPAALENLLAAAREYNAQIVHGRADVAVMQNCKKQIEESEEDFNKMKEGILEKINKVHQGILSKRQILDSWLLDKEYSAFLWGKLFLRETYLDALEHIPPIFNTYSEEIIQYLFIALHAEKYAGINSVVYNYSINTGITSHILITDIKRWEQVCSTASVFTAIFSEIENNMPENLFDGEEEEALRRMCRSMLANNIKQLRRAVVPELQEQAYSLLCEYWGESFVRNIESALDGIKKTDIKTVFNNDASEEEKSSS